MNYPITGTELDLSTWGQDVVRGLDHPDSVRARRLRIFAANKAETERKAKLCSAILAIEANLKTEADVVAVLHVMSSKLAKLHGPDSYLHSVVFRLDKVADSIEFPEGV
jgi:hypothetical protein